MDKKKILIPIIIITAIIILLIVLVNPSKRYKRSIISEEKWNNIISSRTESNNLVLENITFNDYNLMIDENSNTLYYSVINNSKTKYNPNISFSASLNNAKIAILQEEITDRKIEERYNFKLMVYTNKEYHIYNLKVLNLPVLSITCNENLETGKTIPIEIYLFDNLTDNPNKITVSMGKLKINKDSYDVSLKMLTPGKNERENKRTILGLKPNSRFTLIPANEEFEESTSEPREALVELFINSEYKGIYKIK